MGKLTAKKLALKESEIDQAVLPYPIGRPVALVTLGFNNAKRKTYEFRETLARDQR